MTKDLLEALKQLQAAAQSLHEMADNVKLLAASCVICAITALFVSLRKS